MFLTSISKNQKLLIDFILQNKAIKKPNEIVHIMNFLSSFKLQEIPLVCLKIKKCKKSQSKNNKMT